MKKIFLILILSLVGCVNKSNESSCIEYLQNIKSLESEIEILFQNEGKLKAELESAKEYINTLEYENSKLIEMKD